MDMNAFNEKIIAEFRANGGKVEQFGGLPMVILHTIGAKSGTTYLVPLVVIEAPDQLLIFGSFAGAKKHPAWVHNLRAQSTIIVEYGTDTFTATLNELDEEQAQQRVQQQVERSTQFADYVTNAAPRKIPVFTLSLLEKP